MLLVLTKMTSKADYLTAIRADWPDQNLIGLQSILRATYAKTDAETNPALDAVYGTPNRVVLNGFLRWFLLDSYLERGVQIGTLSGITAAWVPLSNGGGIQALELRGKHTTLITHHLQHPDNPPRDSVLRFEKCLMNFQNPMLPGFRDDSEPTESPINLLLVHGDKDAEFAFLRVYDNPENVHSYLCVSNNLMVLPALVAPIEVEEVVEPTVSLKPHLFKKKQEGAGE